MSSGGCERLRQITVEPCMLAANPVNADLRGRATRGAYFGRWNSDGLLNRSTKNDTRLGARGRPSMEYHAFARNAARTPLM